MDDKYYLTEHQVLILNDDHIEKNDFTRCEFTINYAKQIILKRRMECALIKLHCPSELIARPSDCFELKLHLRFVDIDPEINLPKEAPNFNGITHETIDYYFHPKIDTKEEMIERLYQINLDMIENMIHFWNSRYPNEPIGKVSFSDKKFQDVPFELKTNENFIKYGV